MPKYNLDEMELPEFKVENIHTGNWENAIRGMRNPKKSHHLSNSFWSDGRYILCNNDYELAMKLAIAGSDHGKFLRQINLSFDLTAGWNFWKEYSTYKIGTTENSTSMMHTLFDEELTVDNFSWNELTPFRERFLDHANKLINTVKDYDKQIKELAIQIKGTSDDWSIRKKIEDIKEERYYKWRELNDDMIGSYLYTRTCDLNYEVARNMYSSRNNHKMLEWHLLCETFEQLPYSGLITTPSK